MLRIFPKPNLTPEKQKENLEVDINRLQIKYERLTGDYNDKMAILEAEYSTRGANLNREIQDLERTLVSKRQEKSELEKPLTEREHIVSVKESEVKRLFKDLEYKNDELNKREFDIRKQEETVEDFADDLGEAKRAIKERLDTVKAKEHILKQKEQDYLLKVDTQNGLLKDKEKEIDKKIILLDSITIQQQATKENLEGREEILAKKQRLLNDRWAMLERAIKRK
jgi:chromosome segregation ATPase